MYTYKSTFKLKLMFRMAHWLKAEPTKPSTLAEVKANKANLKIISQAARPM